MSACIPDGPVEPPMDRAMNRRKRGKTNGLYEALCAFSRIRSVGSDPLAWRSRFIEEIIEQVPCTGVCLLDLKSAKDGNTKLISISVGLETYSNASQLAIPRLKKETTAWLHSPSVKDQLERMFGKSIAVFRGPVLRASFSQGSALQAMSMQGADEPCEAEFLTAAYRANPSMLIGVLMFRKDKHPTPTVKVELLRLY